MTSAPVRRNRPVVRRWLPLLAVAALLAAVFVASALAEPQFDVAPLTPGGTALTPNPSGSVAASPATVEPSAPPSQDRPFTIPGWVETVLGVLCALSALLIVGVLVFFALRDSIQARGRPIDVEKGAPTPVSHAAEVVAALDAGLDQLARTGSDPRSVVISCWVRLEDAAASAGTSRRPSDAPADYVLRLLEGHQISRQVLDRFAAVYRAARYSFGDVDESMRADAVAALQHLRAELDVRV
jgi:hypothetical protein